MVVMAGFWAAAERNIARLMGFALILEIGFSLIAIGLASGEVFEIYRGIFFSLLLPRGLSLGVWALALSGLMGKVENFEYSSLRGIAQRYPIISTCIVIAILCLAGVPLLASFPVRLGLIAGLANTSLPLTVWVILGSLGLLIAGIRVLASMVMQDGVRGWRVSEPWVLATFLTVGGVLLLLLGIVPDLFRQIISNIPSGF